MIPAIVFYSLDYFPLDIYCSLLFLFLFTQPNTCKCSRVLSCQNNSLKMFASGDN